MNCTNKVELSGPLTRDPFEKYDGASGLAICEFGILVTDDEDDETTNFNITTRGKVAEEAAKMKKGQWIIVKGKLKPDLRVRNGRITPNAKVVEGEWIGTLVERLPEE